MSGFGGRTFKAREREVFVEPLRVDHGDGRTGVQLGFPLATLRDGVSDDTAVELAEYLSCPKRAASPDLYEALVLCREAIVHQDGFGNAWPEIEAALAKARGEQL